MSAASFKGWEELEITVDLGACDTVKPVEACEDIQVSESQAQREGVIYEAAGGDDLFNLGEKRCLLMTLGANDPKRIAFQVADIHKPLSSITRAADAGYECHLNHLGGFMLDCRTGDRIPIHRKGNLYVMRAWVKEVEELTKHSVQRQGRR